MRRTAAADACRACRRVARRVAPEAGAKGRYGQAAAAKKGTCLFVPTSRLSVPITRQTPLGTRRGARVLPVGGGGKGLEDCRSHFMSLPCIGFELLVHPDLGRRCSPSWTRKPSKPTETDMAAAAAPAVAAPVAAAPPPAANAAAVIRVRMIWGPAAAIRNPF